MRKIIFSLTMLATFLLGASMVEAQNYPGYSDATGHVGISYLGVGNREQVPCDPFAPCWDQCNYTLYPSTCDQMATQLTIHISSTTTTPVGAKVTIYTRYISANPNQTSNWVVVENKEIGAYCKIAKPQYNCCSERFDFGFPLHISPSIIGIEYLVVIDPLWTNAPNSTIVYQKKIHTPVLDFDFTINNKPSYNTEALAVQNLVELCIDAPKNLAPKNKGMAEYITAFSDGGGLGVPLSFGNTPTISIQETNTNGVATGQLYSKSILSFPYNTSWDGSEFNLNTLVSYISNNNLSLQAGKYYLIKFYDSESGYGEFCESDDPDFLWIKMISEIDATIQIKTVSGPVSVPPTNSMTNPLAGCNDNSNVYFLVPTLSGTTIINLIIERYDQNTYAYEATIRDEDMELDELDGVGTEVNLRSNLLPADRWGPYFACGYGITAICENADKLYKVSFTFENLCGVSQTESFWFTPSQYTTPNDCKQGFDYDKEWVKLYPNFISEFNIKPKVYPIPATNEIYVDYSKGEVFCIYDINGDKIKEGVVKSNHFKIEMEDYAKGVYFLNIKGLKKEKIVLK